MEKFLQVVGAVTAFCGLVIVAFIVRGFIVSTTWNWLMVPMYEAKPLSIAQGLAISLVVGLLTETFKDYKAPEDEKYKWWEILFRQLIGAFITLAIAYILTFYI